MKNDDNKIIRCNISKQYLFHASVTYDTSCQKVNQSKGLKTAACKREAEAGMTGNNSSIVRVILINIALLLRVGVTVENCLITTRSKEQRESFMTQILNDIMH